MGLLSKCMKKIDLLNLEWSKNERDAHSVAPIVLELRERNFDCITGDIFSYIYYLMHYRPKVLLLTSFQGAKINHEVCSFAHSIGVKVITLIAEGNIRESAIEQMTWGHNDEKQLYFHKMLLWSQRSEKLIHKHFPELLGKTTVVGGVGFDRYKRLEFLSKKIFLKEINCLVNYKKIIGLAGWGFDKVHDTEFYFKNEKSIIANFQKGQKELHQKDFNLIQRHMYNIVKSNQDVLFILRPHPGLTDYYYDEFKKLKNLPNVYYSKPRECPFSTSDLISVSDLWGGYETTTCLEAWLLGKDTFLINPSGSDFNRDATYKGSLIVSNELDLERLIRATDLSLEFDGSENIKRQRNKIISDVIGFDDGENYLRAANEIEPVLLSIKDNPNYQSTVLLKKIGFFKLLKNIIRNINFFNNFRGLRLIEQNQIEGYVELYDKSSKKSKL